MSLRTRINGFTAWINLRLIPYDSLLNNVLTDLTKGFHIQQLLHSLTGKTLKKLQSLDGLTQAQKMSRVEWLVEELKKSEIIPDDVRIDCRLVAMKVGDHVFDLLWRLIAHDIWFTWERMEYLQLDDDKALSDIPFRWTPDPPPKKKKRRVIKTAESMMSGFGASAQVVQDPTPSPETEDTGYEQFPGADRMKAIKPHRPRGGWYSYPPPDECIIDMINSQLERVSEGHKFTVFSLDDLVDSRALCGLINSFVPGTFTTEVMLNDRWTINLALRTVEKMLHASNPMGSEDLSEADPKSICAYMCFFFMCSFKLKQSKAVIQRLKELTLLIQEVDTELVKFPEKLGSIQALKAKKELENSMESYQLEQATLKEAYDIEYIEDWLEHIKNVQKETRKLIADKMKERFDLVTVPRNMSINDLCMSVAINLQLTQGAGFYRIYDKETCTPDRRIVLRVKKTKEFLDDFTGVEGSCNIRDILEIPRNEVTIVEPAAYPKYEFYMESMSRNKMLQTRSIFLYQVFPGNTIKWQRLFFKAVRDGEFEVVKKMVIFFRESHPDFTSSREANSGNTVLHIAARFGHFDICKFLLESGCNVNIKNKSGWTALFFAAEGLHKRVGQLLIEWGCNTKIKNVKCQTAFDLMRHEDMKEFLKDIANLWTATVPQVVRGNLDPLRRITKDHLLGLREMADISARCIKGSTLLHTAVHFGDRDAIKDLLKIRVDVNLKDYQGATPLHRAKDMETLELIMDSNADVNAADDEGNTALHVRAYGEENQSSFMEGVQMLITRGADLIHRNTRGLMPVHCAAMQGRKDVIELLMKDTDDLIKSEVEKEAKDSPPSLPYLAVAANYVNCAKWLVKQSFLFKEGECNRIIYKILTQELIVDDRAEAITFLLENGGLVNLRYQGADSSVHLATRMSGSTDVLQILLRFGAQVDAANEEGCTALFDAMRTNNFHAASILIEHGADVRRKNDHGLAPLDLIHDFDEWIACPLFTEDIIARFKAYKLKHTRDLIRAISKKIQNEAKKAQNLLRQAAQFQQHPLALSMSSLNRQATNVRGASPSANVLSNSLPSINYNSSSWKPYTPSRGRRISFARRLALPPVTGPQTLKADSPQLLF
ncbi:unnamed protein product [Clavelina lepadiformis]|uniref:Calponin-homology (CH) domain-containing protein n=1 Tax=Clavelina lepadiformis TaxID=159417 RepID=A0ABP0FKJ1_CLALP